VLAALDLWGMLAVFPGWTRSRWRSAAEVAPGSGPALVLGCGVERSGDPSPMLEGRLQTALSLYRTGKVPWILVTGYDREPVSMRAWLTRMGVPPAAVVADYAPHRTQESLERAASTFGLHHVVVVTSDFHLPRALWLAEHVGLDAEGVAAPFGSVPPRRRPGVLVRELLARHRALLDVAFPPAPRLGPHDDPPSPAPMGVGPPG
jgi:SanA protein